MPVPSHRWVIKGKDYRSASLDIKLARMRCGKEEDLYTYLFPDGIKLENPVKVFPDLGKALNILEQCISTNVGKIVIVGDYDADGMTSTALLLRTLRSLHAKVDYAIPSRLGEGYGINERIVREFAEESYRVIITVDNGTSAFEPIKLAKELGMLVIVTDHHECPEVLPPADAILNPKLIDQTNVWSQVSGVGMAFILALTLAGRFRKHEELMNPMLELLTIGTLADMVPLTGVNRRWVKKGLSLLTSPSNLGIQALIAAAGLDPSQADFKAETIGFKIAPRINAVGRIGDPQVVIDLLTTEDPMVAMQLAQKCEDCNTQRQVLTKESKELVFDWVEKEITAWEKLCSRHHPSGDLPHPILDNKVLVVILPGIHKGIVGLVASGLVEKYGVPAFVGSYTDDGKKIFGSARASNGYFNVKEALDYCGHTILDTFGGHKGAGGFGLPAHREEIFREKLIEYAQIKVSDKDIGKLVIIDAELRLDQVNEESFKAVQSLQPFGIGNSEPTFYSEKVTVIKAEPIPKTPEHVKFVFSQYGREIKAIGWGFSQYLPLPLQVDIAFKIKENTWNGRTTYEINLESFRESK